MRNMLRFLKGYEKESILAPLFKMLEACFELLVPLVVANIIDVGIKNGDLAYIGKQCGLMVLLAVVGMASSLTAQYFAADGKAAGAKWYTAGPLLKSGQPHHPLYLKKDTQLLDFDIDAYLCAQRAK